MSTARLYGGMLTLGGVFFNSVWLYASAGNRLLGPGITPEGARRIARRFLVGPLSYGMATAVGLASPRVSLAVFAFLIAFYALEGRAGHVSRPALRDV